MSRQPPVTPTEDVSRLRAGVVRGRRRDVGNDVLVVGAITLSVGLLLRLECVAQQFESKKEVLQGLLVAARPWEERGGMRVGGLNALA